MKKILVLIEKWRKKCILRDIARKQAETRSHFYIEERNDTIYIMCGNNAIKEVAHNTSSSEIINELNIHRQAALSYRGYGDE